MFLLGLQTQFQLSHTLLYHKVPLYPQHYEDARELFKRSSSYSKATLVFFKGVLIVKNITKLKKIQQRAALWITGAFQTSPSEDVEAIAGLIPITLHLCKLNDRHHLYYASISPSHAINLLLDSQHSKNQSPHRAATSKLTAKQQANLKSPIKNVNKCLNGVRNCFNHLHPLFSPGSRVVDHFSSRISFNSPSSSPDKDLYQHFQSLNYTLSQMVTYYL